MAPSNTPWHGWATTFPGSIERGPIPSKLVMFLPLTLFLLQAAYAAYSFWGPVMKKEVSKFYATLIVLNIIAMSLMAGFFTLNGLLPGFFDAEKQFELTNAAMAMWYISVLLFSLIHSVNNCCRVVFDAYGLRAAVRFIPVAVLCQGWQVIALPFGFSPFTGMIALVAIDYVQHTIALAYWSIKICTGGSKKEEDKRRLWYGVGGVTLHMVSVLPQIYYVVTFPTEEQTTAGLCAVYAACTAFMFVSQCFWIAMTLRTPPCGRDDKSKTFDQEEQQTTEHNEGDLDV